MSSPESVVVEPKFCDDTVLYTLKAWVTNDDISPAFDGRIKVLLVLAKCLKAEMYCSANVKEAAFLPFLKKRKNIY